MDLKLGELNDKSDLVNWVEILMANFGLGEAEALTTILPIYNRPLETVVFCNSVLVMPRPEIAPPVITKVGV